MPGAANRIQLIDRPDPKKVILDKIKDAPGYTIASDELMVAIYQRSDVSPGGIALTANLLKEDVYQGKVGLIIKIGAKFTAEWTDPYTKESGGIPVKLHDWIVFRPSDTWPIEVNIQSGIHDKGGFVVCRMVKNRAIRAVIDNADMVW